jgi:hypothetical protein
MEKTIAVTLSNGINICISPHRTLSVSRGIILYRDDELYGCLAFATRVTVTQQVPLVEQQRLFKNKLWMEKTIAVTLSCILCFTCILLYIPKWELNFILITYIKSVHSVSTPVSIHYLTLYVVLKPIYYIVYGF